MSMQIRAGTSGWSYAEWKGHFYPEKLAAKDMLRYDLDNENETIRNYRDRIPQCEALGEYAMAEQIREILVQEQDHQIDLATALGEEVPNVNAGPQQRTLRKRR